MELFSFEPYDEFLSFVCVFVCHYFCSVGIWLGTSGGAVWDLIAATTLTLTPGVCLIVLMMWQRKLMLQRWCNQNSPNHSVTLNWPGEKKKLLKQQRCVVDTLSVATHRQRSIPSSAYLCEWQSSTVPLNCSLYSPRKNARHLSDECILLFKQICVWNKCLPWGRAKINAYQWVTLSFARYTLSGGVH